MHFTSTVTAASGNESHSKAWVNVIYTGVLLLKWCLWAAFFLIWALVIVHHQLLHLHKALDYRYHPKVHLRSLQYGAMSKVWLLVFVRLLSVGARVY